MQMESYYTLEETKHNERDEAFYVAKSINPFLSAIASGLNGLAEKMLPFVVNIDEKDKCNRTALMMAAAYGEMDLVKQLLKKGANVNLQDNLDFTAPMWAAMMGHKEIAELLLAAPAAEQKLEAKMLLTAGDILKLKNKEGPPVKLLPRLLNLIPNLERSERGFNFSHYDVSRADESLLDGIAWRFGEKTADKLNLIDLLYFYSALKRLTCLFMLKDELLAELREMILAHDLAKVFIAKPDSSLLNNISASADEFSDFPNAKQLQDYISNTTIIANFIGNRNDTPFSMAKNMFEQKFFDNTDAAFEFILSRSELTPTYLEADNIERLFEEKLTPTQKQKLLEKILGDENILLKIDPYFGFKPLLEAFRDDKELQIRIIEVIQQKNPTLIKQIVDDKHLTGMFRDILQADAFQS